MWASLIRIAKSFQDVFEITLVLILTGAWWCRCFVRLVLRTCRGDHEVVLRSQRKLESTSGPGELIATASKHLQTNARSAHTKAADIILTGACICAQLDAINCEVCARSHATTVSRHRLHDWSSSLCRHQIRTTAKVATIGMFMNVVFLVSGSDWVRFGGETQPPVAVVSTFCHEEKHARLRSREERSS